MKIFLNTKAPRLVALLLSLLFSMQAGVTINRTCGAIAISVGGSIFIGIVLLWMWSAGRYVNQRIKREIKPGLFSFYACFLVVLLVAPLHIAFVVREVTNAMKDMSAVVELGVQLVIGGGMICLFRLCYFIAKNIMLAEGNCAPRQGELVKLALQLCVFPFGLYLVQPRINRIFASRDNARQTPTSAVATSAAHEE